jgi:hypothetical protein
MSAPALVTPTSLFEARLEQLAPPVRRKFQALDDHAQALGDAALSAFTAWQDAHQRLAEVRAAHSAAEDSDKRTLNSIHARAKAVREGRPYEPPPGSALAQAAVELARREDREARRRADRDRTEQDRTAALTLVLAIRTVVETSDPAALPAITVPASPHRTPPRDAAADLERLRAQIASVTAERRALDRAPLPLEESGARLDQFLADMASLYTPPVAAFLNVEWRGPSPDECVPYKLFPLLASLPEVRAVLHGHLRAAYAHAPASVATADRPGLRAALLERCWTLEVEEERVVLEAEAAGLSITRRGELDPVVALTVVLAAP